MRPGIGVQALKVALDTLDTIAVFVHLYFRSGRGMRNIDLRTLPYTDRSKKKLAPPLAEVLKPPEQNRGLAALFDFSAELDEQSKSSLRALVQRRHAATHRFFSLFITRERPIHPTGLNTSVGQTSYKSRLSRSESHAAQFCIWPR